MLPRPLLAASAVLLASTLLGAAPLSSQAAEPLLVGVLRADGIAVPDAFHDRGRWTRLPWDSVPDLVLRHEGPWYQVRAGAPDHPLRGGSVVRFTGSDEWYEPWGVVTDFAPRSVDASSFPAGRVGAVLSQPHPAVAFEPLRPATPEGRRLLALLRPEFERHEARQLAHEEEGPAPDRTRTGHPRAAAARSRAPLRLERAYRTEADVGGRRLFYAVLRRDYPRFTRADTVYQPLSALGAWVAEEAGRLRLLDATLQLDSGSEMQVSTAEPFAALQFGERVYVLAEYWLYEGSERTVLEIGRAGVTRVLPSVF